MPFLISRQLHCYATDFFLPKKSLPTLLQRGICISTLNHYYLPVSTRFNVTTLLYFVALPINYK